VSFNSFVFFVFLVCVLPVWWGLAGRPVLRSAWLVAASFVFYGWVHPWWLLPLIFSGLVDFCAGLLIVRWVRWKNVALLVSIGTNLLVLGWFKYAGFFAESFGLVASTAGGTLGSYGLPAGISFYTFQSLSYTIDVWAGRLQPTRRPVMFFAYLSCFPQLVAGPIVRARDLLYRVEDPPRPTAQAGWAGAGLVLTGLGKKLLVADNLSPYVDAIFAASPGALPGGLWWWGAVLFTVQIYCDFSGYTDIARGLGCWMGLPLPENFKQPYLAFGLRDFWARWHITLSTWFRDYVYIPLGGDRHGRARSYLNLWIAFLLSGLWHGAAWKYVAWGAVHAAGLSVERVTGWTERLRTIRAGRIVGVAGTLVFIVATWVLFRARDLPSALGIYRAMAGLTTAAAADFQVFFGLVPVAAVTVLVAGEIVVAIGWAQPAGRWLAGRPVLAGGLGGFLLGLIVLLRGPGQQFIYFQF